MFLSSTENLIFRLAPIRAAGAIPSGFNLLDLEEFLWFSSLMFGPGIIISDKIYSIVSDCLR